MQFFVFKLKYWEIGKAENTKNGGMEMRVSISFWKIRGIPGAGDKVIIGGMGTSQEIKGNAKVYVN